MKKIIFFDIDGTLFNPIMFLDNFYSKLFEIFELGDGLDENLKTTYEKIRNQQGYFVPALFLEEILRQYPQIQAEELKKIFWDIDLFQKSMYKDSSVIRDLAKIAILGIFSKGDKDFQKYKLSFINDLLDVKNIYIFPNKLEKISEVFGKYSDFKIYLVDDNLEVLNNTKQTYQNIVTILIDRKDKETDNKSAIRIKNLEEIQKII